MASGRRSVLVVIHGELRPNMAGPAVRGWEVARALALRFHVTAVAPGAVAGVRDGVRLVRWGRRTIVREALRHDAVIAPELPPYLLLALRRRGVLRVADQFGPVELESATLGGAPRVARQISAQRSMRRLQLRFADVVVAANEPQRLRTLAQLRELGMRDGFGPRVVTVPFGLPKPPARSGEHPLRSAFGLGAGDVVVLWWGSIWRWLDADTALRAFALVAEQRPAAKFVLPEGAAPSAGADVFSAAQETRALAAELGLLDRSVFFLHDWVPYSRRHEYVQDADLGLVLHRDTPEAAIAARSRYLDYLWCGTPCVLAHGDELAARMGEAGFATLVAPRDVDATAAALLRLIDDHAARASARAAGEALADEYRWDRLVKPLEHELNAPPRTGHGAVAPAAASYYFRRLADRAATAAGR